jgi:hypothetical protein
VEATREETTSLREAPRRRDMRRRRDWHSVPARPTAKVAAESLVAAGRRERRPGIAISDGER